MAAKKPKKPSERMIDKGKPESKETPKEKRAERKAGYK